MQLSHIPPSQKEFPKPRETIGKADPALIDLGRIDYLDAYSYQKNILEDVIAGRSADTLILCEHPHTFTAGRNSDSCNLLVDESYLHSMGASLITTDRGGDITYHGPGQLVAYPIFNLLKHGKDLKRFLTNLEQVVIDFLSEFEIIASRIDGKTGVWFHNKKIASIGIGVRHWVSFHGLAINLTTDMRFFSLIRPCGLDAEMVSLEQIIGSAVGSAQAKNILHDKFTDVFYTRKGINV